MKKFVAALAFFVLAIAPGAARAEQNPRVVVSIKPIHSLVAGIMKGVATPALLVDGNATPYDFRLAEKHLKQLGEADLVIWVGPELEPYLTSPLGKQGAKTKVVELLASDILKVLLSRSAKGGRDPFLWLDIRNGEALVDELFNAISAADPKHEAIYKKNRNELKRRIGHMEREFEYGFRSIAAGDAWAYHDTQQYFEQAYALRINGHASPNPGTPADTAKLLKFRAEIAQRGKGCFLTEAGMTTDKLSLLAEGSGARIIELDSLATRFKPGFSLYEDVARHNFNAIADCFKAIGARYKPPASRRSGPD